MAKHLKLKFSRVITSFNSCRSKDPSTLPSNPVSSFLRLSPVKLRLQPPPKPHNSSIKRHMSLALASIKSGFRTRSTVNRFSETAYSKSAPEFQWEKEEKWHVVAKMYDETPRRKISNSLAKSDFDNHNILLPPPSNKERKRRRIKKKKKSTPRIYVRNSSTDSGLFSSEGLDEEEDDIYNKETETLVSSTRSFSDYSSPDFSDHLQTISEEVSHPFNINHRNKKVKKAKRHVARKARKSRSEAASFSPARLSTFERPLPCTVDGKVKESFAVVKKSEDPYEDFKMSMMEMIMEKEMFEVKDLEQLLQCFLYLNSKEHHGVIVEVFSEIWESLFSTNSISLCQ